VIYIHLRTHNVYISSSCYTARRYTSKSAYPVIVEYRLRTGTVGTKHAKSKDFNAVNTDARYAFERSTAKRENVGYRAQPSKPRGAAKR
jgi:hypothetical protein